MSDRPGNPLTWLLLGLVRAYQLVVSPWLPQTCRYHPSCSAYAVTALHRHGPFKGLVLAAWRLLRCNPWTKGGVDHVPPRGLWRNPPSDQHVHASDGAEDRLPAPTTPRKPRTLRADTRGARATAPQD